MGGTVDTSGPASTRYEIDNVRVYQKQPGTVNDTILTNRPSLKTSSLSFPAGTNASRIIEFSNYPHAVGVIGSIPGMTLLLHPSRVIFPLGQSFPTPVAGRAGNVLSNRPV